MHRPPDACTTSHAPPGTPVTLTQARIFSHHGVIIDAENHLLRDLSPDLIPPPEGHRILRYPSLPDPVPVAGRIFSLTTPSSQKSYFHWLLDTIPRVRHIERDHFDLFHTPLLHPFHRELLERLKIPPERWLEAGDETHFLCHQLTSVSPLPLGSIDADDLAFLRSLFPQQPVHPSRRLYLSRGDSWRRRILNEDALLDLLAPLGFEVIHCRDLTVAQQVHLAAQAEIILAPHGAALTNLIFAPPTCQVIELLATNYQFPYFKDLAKLCGLNYQRHVSPNPTKHPDHILELESLQHDILNHIRPLA